MTESIAERAFCAIEKRLRAIRTEDGYKTDAGLNVFRARRTFGESDLPGCSLWDVGESVPSGSAARTTQVDLKINIDAVALAGQANTGAVMGRLKSDIKRALFGTEKRDALDDDDGKIGQLGYLGATCFPRDDGGQTEAITLQFHISYSERTGDPYAPN